MADPYGALAAAKLRSIAGSPRLLALRSAGDLLIVSMEALAAVVLVSRFGSIAGWTAGEVGMLIGTARAGEGLALVVGRGIDPIVFGDKVRTGQFDQVLTRPVHPLPWLLASDIEVRFVFRAVAGAAVVAWSAAHASVAATPANLALLAGAAVASAVFVLATLVIGAALTFRTVEGSDIANLVVNGGLGLVAFPLDLYASPIRFTFTFLIPVALCVYVPVLTVLGRDGPGGLGPHLLAALPMGLGAFVALAGLAWRSGVRHYESTGS
ncbi:MAG: ABC-2 family transporter protein [Actinomycetota bacterium]|nr:ABC-2 family transporter protein [Actinomycetota bacterium]